MEDAIRLEHITKTFGSVVANRDISLSIRRGEILSLLGENGSGKTTLMNILSGIYYPDEGQIFVGGEEVTISSPKDAFDLGIGMIHQHFKLVDVFTAAENIVLGLPAEMNGGRRFDIKAATSKIREICGRYGFDLDPDQKVYEMTVSQKQTLEIVKVLYRGADILILDEPTAVLTPQETDKLFAVMREMKKDGKAVVIITHKLHEVLDVSDRVAILRKGEYIGTVDTKDATELSLTEMMVGKKVSLDIERQVPKNPVRRLKVDHLSVLGPEGVSVLNDVSFEAFGGEILGIAGISGCGQKELLEAIAGLQITEENSSVKFYPAENEPEKKKEVSRLLKTNRTLLRVLLLSLVTFGIYGIVANTKLSKDLNRIASGRDGRKTMNFCLALLLGAVTAEVVMLVWFHKISNRIGKELEARGISYPISASTFWGWFCLGSLLFGVGPFVYLHKFYQSMSLLAADYNAKLIAKQEEEDARDLAEGSKSGIQLLGLTPRQIKELGIHLSFVPEDRLGMGLVGSMGMTDNMMLKSYNEGKSLFTEKKAPRSLAEDVKSELAVVTPNVNTPVRRLSGGNVQKVLVGREIAAAPAVLMTAYAVRGLDIGTSYQIYMLLNQQKEDGVAVIYVGEDLDVLLELCDRILVLCAGHVTGIVDGRSATKEQIGLLMTKAASKGSETQSSVPENTDPNNRDGENGIQTVKTGKGDEA